MRLATLITLIEIECKKILPWLLGVFALVTIGTSLILNSAIGTVHRETLSALSGSSVPEFIASNGYITLSQVFQHWSGTLVPLLYFMGAILTVMISFIMWQREWMGQSKRIYMLLSLKGPRMTILLSKLITILMAVFTYLGVIIISIAIGALLLLNTMPRGIVGRNLVSQAIGGTMYLDLTLPLTFMDFIYKLLFVLLMFGMITVFVMAHRSFRWPGIICGACYFVLLIAIFIHTQSMFLFFDEQPWVDFGFVIVGNILSYGISWRLLNKHVSI